MEGGGKGLAPYLPKIGTNDLKDARADGPIIDTTFPYLVSKGNDAPLK